MEALFKVISSSFKASLYIVQRLRSAKNVKATRFIAFDSSHFAQKAMQSLIRRFYEDVDDILRAIEKKE